jgi:hypothetical protein
MERREQLDAGCRLLSMNAEDCLNLRAELRDVDELDM